MNKTILLTATWCGPCSVLKNKMINESLNVDEIFDIDTPEAKEVYTKYEVRTVPTLLVVDENEELVETYKGIQDTIDYLKTIQ